MSGGQRWSEIQPRTLLGKNMRRTSIKKIKFLHSDPSVFATTRHESGDIHLSN